MRYRSFVLKTELPSLMQELTVNLSVPDTVKYMLCVYTHMHLKLILSFIIPHVKILDSGWSIKGHGLIVMISSLLTDRLLSLTAYEIVE